MDYIKFINKAKDIYKNEPTGHDFSHIERVFNFCKIIQQKEGGDEFVLLISALFHDVHRVLSNKENRYVPAEESVPVVKKILNDFKINEEDLNKILFTIKNHETKILDSNMPIELQILQDADILDALGETGLKRTLTYCKNKNIPIYNKNYPLNSKKYIPDIFPISTTHYVYRTMIPNANKLHTETGKAFGKQQIKILQNFVNENVENFNLSYN